MQLAWEDGFSIRVTVNGDGAVISANKEGLESLAGIFAALAREMPGEHAHLDEYNSLEDGSAELIIECLP